METIASFNTDHREITPGVYISRVDGDVTTYDLRTRKPNTGDIMSNSVMHSVEHMFATFVRNSEIGNRVLYFGPMGCQTGFYLLIRSADHQQVIKVIKQVLRGIAAYEGAMPGNSELECGNYKSLNLECAKAECQKYYDAIKNMEEKDLAYKQSR